MKSDIIVHGDADPASREFMTMELRCIQERLLGLWGGVPPTRFTARLFGTHEGFRQFAVNSGASNAECFYDPRTGEVVMEHIPWRERFLRNLAHEATHQYMDRVWGRTGPLWFAEGMAEYFTEVYGLGPPPSCPGEPMTLAEFAASGREVFYGPLFPSLYWRAYRLVKLLMERSPEVIRSLLSGGHFAVSDGIEAEWNEVKP